MPNKIIVGSIMASHSQSDWEQLARMSVDADFDVL